MPRETVGIEQAHEELKVLFLAVVRGGGEQQEVAGMVPDALGKEAPLRLLNLAGEQLRGELVSLIEHNEVPIGSVVEEELEVLVTAQLVEPRDHQVRITERVT